MILKSFSYFNLIAVFPLKSKWFLHGISFETLVEVLRLGTLKHTGTACSSLGGINTETYIFTKKIS